MTTTILTLNDLARTKEQLKKNLRIKSGHLSEALAIGLGSQTHAALLSAIRKEDGVIEREVDVRAFVSRLVELGHGLDVTHAEMAFIHALRLSGPLEEASPAWIVQSIEEHISAAKANLRRTLECSRFFLDYEGVPDPTVPTIRIERDVWRWNPNHLRLLSREELGFSVFVACLHRHLGHPARRGKRDPKVWSIACELVANDAGLEAKAGIPLSGCHWKGRFHKDRTAEEVYADLADGHDPKRLLHDSATDFGEWALPGKKWPATAGEVLVKPSSKSWDVLSDLWGGDIDYKKEIVGNDTRFGFLLRAVVEEPGDADEVAACKILVSKVRGIEDEYERLKRLDDLIRFAVANLRLSTSLAIAKAWVFDFGMEVELSMPGWLALSKELKESSMSHIPAEV